MAEPDATSRQGSAAALSRAASAVAGASRTSSAAALQRGGSTRSAAGKAPSAAEASPKALDAPDGSGSVAGSRRGSAASSAVKQPSGAGSRRASNASAAAPAASPSSRRQSRASAISVQPDSSGLRNDGGDGGGRTSGLSEAAARRPSNLSRRASDARASGSRRQSQVSQPGAAAPAPAPVPAPVSAPAQPQPARPATRAPPAAPRAAAASTAPPPTEVLSCDRDTLIAKAAEAKQRCAELQREVYRLRYAGADPPPGELADCLASLSEECAGRRIDCDASSAEIEALRLRHSEVLASVRRLMHRVSASKTQAAVAEGRVAGLSAATSILTPDRDKEAAAVRIQAVFRGHRMRSGSPRLPSSPARAEAGRSGMAVLEAAALLQRLRSLAFATQARRLEEEEGLLRALQPDVPPTRRGDLRRTGACHWCPQVRLGAR
eukprot:TRINITY_DN14021_c0_g1_i2.p1 TRINITY_DN14021_c0_g1~~TRINITY_DN14021_c0_g1_i2.p1  ORF type:complete len:459 (+),score=70.61 TRINITY_DN14021_c0_g1_i2:71-1378(+)